MHANCKFHFFHQKSQFLPEQLKTKTQKYKYKILHDKYCIIKKHGTPAVLSSTTRNHISQPTTNLLFHSYLFYIGNYIFQFPIIGYISESICFQPWLPTKLTESVNNRILCIQNQAPLHIDWVLILITVNLSSVT